MVSNDSNEEFAEYHIRGFSNTQELTREYLGISQLRSLYEYNKVKNDQ